MSQLSWVDSHCHFDFDAFAEDRSLIWRRCRARGLTALVVPGVAPAQWPAAAQLSRSMVGIYYGVGVHPWWVDEVYPQASLSSQTLDDLRDRLTREIATGGCVALGECGLDKHCDSDWQKQRQLFDCQVALAAQLQVPLIIHVRKAHNEVLDCLREHRPPAGGVIHGFSGSLELAENYWELGFYLGIGGTITYPRAEKTRAAVTHMPLDSLLLETDAPDMPLQGRQGERNSPIYLTEIGETLAQLRDQPLATIAEQTTRNASRLFGMI